MANEDTKRLAWIRSRPCLACGASESEAHHCGRSGMGLRPDDSQAVPLCHACHMALHDMSGQFKLFERHHVKAWECAMAELTQRRYDTHSAEDTF